MLKLTRILVPIDFSEFTEKAVQYGAEFAKTFGADVLLGHVSELPNYPIAAGLGMDPPPFIADDVLPEINKRLLTIERDLIASGVRASHMIVEGTPFVEIVNLAREQKIDLIVMPTHGRTGLSHMFIGSTAERVVRRAPCPVLVIRSDESESVDP